MVPRRFSRQAKSRKYVVESPQVVGLQYKVDDDDDVLGLGVVRDRKFSHSAPRYQFGDCRDSAACSLVCSLLHFLLFFFSSFPFSLSFPRVLLGMHLGSFGIPRLTCTPVLLFYYLSLDIADLQGYE